MYCGELMYQNMSIMTHDSGPIGPKQRPEKETIHSGHFMVSHFEAEEQDDEDELAVPVPEEGGQPKLAVVGVSPVLVQTTSKDEVTSQSLSIETSLTKLFKCMSLAYRQKLTSPKWNRFKGIRLRWKDKIRLNNVIWRCWHMQFIKKKNTLVCQFASPLDVDTHNKPEAVVLEGKYWKRKLAAVTAEYKKWRMFHRNRLGWGSKDGSDILSEMDMLEWQPHSDESMNMLVDEDYMEFMTDTLFSTLTANQPFAFPDSREIARAPLADFIQPSLGPLQPNLEDFMDTLEPLQELYNKLPSVPEEPSPVEFCRPTVSTYPEIEALRTVTAAAIIQQEQPSALTGSSLQYATGKPPFMPPQLQQNSSYNATSNVPPPPPPAPRVDASYPNANVQLYVTNTIVPQHQSPSTVNIGKGRRPSRASQKTNRTLSEQTQVQQALQHQQMRQQAHIQQQQQQQAQTQQRAQQQLYIQQKSAEPERLQYQGYQQRSASTGNIVASIMASGGPRMSPEHRVTFNLSPSPPPPQPQTDPLQLPAEASQLTVGPMQPTQQQQQMVQSATNIQGYKFHPPNQQGKFASVLTSPHVSETFKVPAVPTAANWSPPPSLPTYVNTQVPVQFIAQNESLAQQQSTQLKDSARSGPMATSAGKYGSYKQRSRVRSSSLGPRQGPPPLVSSASDPALLSHTNSVLLAQLLTNNSQSVFTVNSGGREKSEGAGMFKSNLAQSRSMSSSHVPILPMPSPPATTTLLITTPLQMSNVTPSVAAPLTNQMLMNPLATNPSISTGSPTDSPVSPRSPVGPIGSPLGDRGTPGPHREQRRVGHIYAEQKRRYNIKNGFDTLHSLIPQLNQNPNTKLSKAAMLQKGAEYIQQLRAERNQLKEEMDSLKQQIECLNTSISNCQSLLPATGAPVSRQRASKMREMFDEYVRIRTNENWKFWIFSILVEPLVGSYNSSVSTASPDDLYRSVILWVEQHCSLVDLRPAVLQSLRYISTKTDILSDPARLPEEARQAVNSKSHQRPQQ